MALPLDKPVESPFKTKGSLGRALVDGNDQDISNINHYLALLAQTADKKERLRRKKRRERRERKKMSSGTSKDRKKSRKHRHRHDKGKEVSPDTPQLEAETSIHVKQEQLERGYSEPVRVPGMAIEHRGGLLVAPTLPTSGASRHPNMRAPETDGVSLQNITHRSPRAYTSPSAMEVASPAGPIASTATCVMNNGFGQPRSSSWSQFIIDHNNLVESSPPPQGGGLIYRPHPHPHPSRLQSFPQTGTMHHSLTPPGLDPSAAEFLQLMSEHQSCSNPSFTFSSSFSSDSFSAIPEEPVYGGFLPPAPNIYHSPSPSLPHHYHPIQHSPAMTAALSPSAFFCSDPLMPTVCSDAHHGTTISPSSTSSFSALDPVEDRDGTFASLDFLEAALAHDIMGGQ